MAKANLLIIWTGRKERKRWVPWSPSKTHP
jgi:hypothetical protein